MNMGDTATHEHADMAWSTNQQTWVWYVGVCGLKGSSMFKSNAPRNGTETEVSIPRCYLM